MPFDLLIRNGQLVTPDGVESVAIAVQDGKIVELAPEIGGSARETIDATGLQIFPGMIDPHVHFNEPGRAEWEGLATGSAALAAGGGTCFFDMPLNSSPPVLDGKSFDLKRRAAEASSRTDFALWGGLTPGNLDRLEELADRGAVGFKAFMCNSGIDDFPAADDYTLFRGMQIAAKLGLLVAVHAENDALTAGLSAAAMKAGKGSVGDYLKSRPVVAEVEAIRRATALAREAGCRLHIVHVSSGQGASAAHVGGMYADVTFETCPHYFLLTEEDLPKIGPGAKCSPPLRSRRDADDLIYALSAGEISFVGSDHSPSPATMKQGDNWFKLWGGIAGVQSTLAAMLSINPPLPLPAVAAYTSRNIARRFNIPKATIEIGHDGDFALVDVRADYELTREMLLDRHKLSPYVGRKFRGAIKRTIVRGHTVFRDGKTAGDFRGRLVTPDRAVAQRRFADA